jgi:hypothetical protein
VGGVGDGRDDDAMSDGDVVSDGDERGEVSARPALTPELAAEEFRRWYFLKTELVTFAREMGVTSSGSKEDLTARIALALTGGEAVAPPSDRRVRAGRQLERPVSAASVIPTGQRCSQVLREFFASEVGPSFRFDAGMRDFIANGEGRTLGDAVDHWRATRDRGQSTIGRQFELNRFTRQWYQDNPNGHRDGLRAAWLTYRNQPEELRGRA